MQSPVGLVLGATGGIGGETARRLAAAGWRLVLAGRDPERLEPLARSLGATPVEVDARDVAQVEAAVSQAVEQHGRLDGLANCFGTLLLKPAHLTTYPEWQETLEVNLTSAFAAVRAGAQVMSKDGGSIVLVSTAAARIGLANHEAIAAAKGGVQGLALAAAASYAQRRIRVNVVAPGLVRTRLAERVTANEAALKISTNMHPLGRIGEPSDVASLIAWLLDPANGWVTGQVMGVDGGLGTLRSRG
jgi:NAD(P)-dependent dehydrogenase (short-subunit alcohol dehydrogenase family)